MSTVHPRPPVDVGPGWLYGEIEGRLGLLPETYVKPVGESAHSAHTRPNVTIDPFDPFGVHKNQKPSSGIII
ncbi:unnamed protein product [Protopolystoma xenopodis]|uniref:SH3 domain-containing protein n=1 Tax=Protopolystoma xenopodis TaxID=117903 RepID=A0A3S5B888_9PLAT|nr:unnamed protein product [Protopolystoma xenopodis]